MEKRHIERLGREVSVVGLGTWQLGADWGSVADEDALAVLRAAYDHGVTLYDTADVYGDGRGERFCAVLRTEHPEILVATKMGRRVAQHLINYSADNFRAWNQRSRENLGVDRLDLVQLHCPPDDVYDSREVFDALDELVERGWVARYGVSVETCDQALRAIERPGVATVQIILNCFRLKPLDEVLPAARRSGVGIIARVPLASGLLSGKYDERTEFGPDDHRSFNRHGQAFDVGETFAGVPFDVGLRAVEELREVAGDRPLAEFALRWVIDQPGVSTVIPGARNPQQARRNAAAADSEAVTRAQREGVQRVYDRLIREHVHDSW